MPQPEVRNAADPQQVRRARSREKDRGAFERSCFLAVLQEEYGRAAMRLLLERFGVYRSVWDQSAQRVAYNAGRQDAGHELQAVLLEASEPLYQLMESEALARARREQVATDAAHTPPAGGA
jgi:hypothetical protein